MKFSETEFYKHFGDAEWKVTTNDGKVYKSKNWLPSYEDKNYREAALYVADSRIEVARKSSKTIVNTKFK
jgi:hypothetical protein